MFLDDNYLITGETGKILFDSVRDLPILDPHNHADVAALARNRNFPDVWNLLAATDHYVWEVMRKAGVAEKFITGNADSHQKFLALAEVFDDLAGNPVYEWIHLDLRFLGIDSVLNVGSGESIWREANNILACPDFRPAGMLKKMHVEIMCSTDDPADTLESHRQANILLDGATVIHPTWRPDAYMKISAPAFPSAVSRLAQRFGKPIATLDALLDALKQSHDYFESAGCRASDHGLETAPRANGSRTLAAQTFTRALGGGVISPDDESNFTNFLMGEFGSWNAASNWVTQLHVGAVRNVRNSLFQSLGPDSGGDICNMYQDHVSGLLDFLNRFDGRLKTVLYALDPAHIPALASITRAFGANVRPGAAWWLCDTPVGMKRQLETLGDMDLLSTFAGMVSDSRKLTSYGSRFEMFRRILSDRLGVLVDSGRMPEAIARKLAAKICYNGPKQFFNF